MAERPSAPLPNEEALRAEIARLNKIIHALMNRAERSMSIKGSDFNLFQTAVLLDDQVRQRTAELKTALEEVQALQTRLREQAIRDPLTGLFNRRYLTETFDRELLRAHRNGSPISAIMGDIDHFKSVNDTYGHQAGDEVLRAFGTLLKQGARGSDICCRYGGEEFLLVLFDMAIDDAWRRAERLRQAVAAAAIPLGASVVRITASFGIASFPAHGETGEALIAAADAALYAAKKAGRNQTRTANR